MTDVSTAEFRHVMGHFATGVTVVTSVDADGEPVGTTANAVTSLSLDPPLILVCFDLGSLTLRAIRGHGAFVVNVLAAPQQQLSANFARRGLAAAWDGVRHRRGPTGSPLLEDVLAVLECTVEHALPGGDHEIVVGRVRHAETAQSVENAALPPLLYYRGAYVELASLGASLGDQRRGTRIVAQYRVQDAVAVGAVAPGRAAGDALAPEAGRFKRLLLGDVAGLGVRLDAVGRGVPEKQVGELGLGGGTDTAAAVLPPEPDTDHRAPGSGGRPPLLPVPADAASHLPVVGDHRERAVAVEPGRPGPVPDLARAEVVEDAVPAR